MIEFNNFMGAAILVLIGIPTYVFLSYRYARQIVRFAGGLVQVLVTIPLLPGIFIGNLIGGAYGGKVAEDENDEHEGPY